MPATSASAPGKIILFGEHAVVYRHPAIAIPVESVRAKVFILADPLRNPPQVRIESSAINLDTTLSNLHSEHPLNLAVRAVMKIIGISQLPAMHIKISSSIPLATGMGSSAAVSIAFIRALSAFLGHPLEDPQVNQLAYEVEVQQHGTPSGIDNTVITYGRPVYFIRDKPAEILQVTEPVFLVIADSGICASTREMVSGVRNRLQSNPEFYNPLFSSVGRIAQKGREIIEYGPICDLGELLTENHALLQQMGVSIPPVDDLVKEALSAGALGAKLSGSGGGGIIIALVKESDTQKISSALTAAGALLTITTHLNPTSNTRGIK